MTETRIFEMRVYYAFPGRLNDLQARFRNHTLALFERHGIDNIGYFVPTDGEGASTTLVYLLGYPDREEATARWAAFQADPEWIAAKAASEVNGLLVERVESTFMAPTDFSPIK